MPSVSALPLAQRDVYGPSGPGSGGTTVQAVGVNLGPAVFYLRLHPRHCNRRFVHFVIVAPAHASGLISFEMSNNQDFTQRRWLSVRPYRDRNQRCPQLWLSRGWYQHHGYRNELCRPNVHCRVGTKGPILGVRSSNTAAVCVALRSLPAVPVEVTNNNQTYTTNSVQYVYVSVFTVSGISPVIGPSVGGTVVTVSGSQFLNSAQLVCRFGSSVVSASWLSATSLKCAAPATAPSVVSLEVSNNNQDFTTDNFQYTFFVVPTVASLFPCAAVAGTPVTVTGSNFTAGAYKFGALGASCPPSECTQILCATVPARGSVAVEVASNNQDFSSNSVVPVH